MKKIISVLFSFVVLSFCFVFAEENSEDFQDIQDMQEQFVQSLDDSEADSFFDALDDSNRIIEDENSRIEEEKEIAELEKKRLKEQEAMIRRKKRENNTLVSGISLGGNFPFYFASNSTGNESDNNPFGISLQYTGSSYFWTFKCNLNWDFIKDAATNSNFVWTASLGITPVHNDYCFIGLYGTMGSDEIENYSYTSLGISTNMMFYFTHFFGLSLNIDATCRTKEEYKGDEEIPPYLPRYKDSWRIAPSIGFVFLLMNG